MKEITSNVRLGLPQAGNPCPMAPRIAFHDGGTDCLYRTEIKNQKKKKEMKHKTKFG